MTYAPSMDSTIVCQHDKANGMEAVKRAYSSVLGLRVIADRRFKTGSINREAYRAELATMTRDAYAAYWQALDAADPSAVDEWAQEWGIGQ